TGMVVVTFCWLLLAPYVLGRDRRGRLSGRLGRADLDRVIASWALPLALAPPMFSKDVYSYLAQGAIGNELADPYALGPVSALGHTGYAGRRYQPRRHPRMAGWVPPPASGPVCSCAASAGVATPPAPSTCRATHLPLPLGLSTIYFCSVMSRR